MSRRALSGLLATVLGAACAGAPPEAPGEATAAPPTDRDPPPYVPAPEDGARTGHAVGIVTSGGFEQARALTIRIVEAVRDGDRQALEERLADPIGRTRPRLLTPRDPRAQRVTQLLDVRHQRHAIEPGTPIEELIDPDGIEVVPLAQHAQDEDIPEGFLPTDLYVTVPIRDRGRRYFGVALQWLGEGRLVVRPGPDPLVVAL